MINLQNRYRRIIVNHVLIVISIGHSLMLKDERLLHIQLW